MNLSHKHYKPGLPTVIEMQYIDTERQRISGELHDNVSSKLAVIRHLIVSKPDSTNEILQLLDKTVITLRRISYNLHLPYLDRLKLVEAIRDFLQPLHGIFEVEIADLSLVEDYLQKQVKLNVYRIFQEVLNNILKHAQASFVHVLIKLTNEELRLVIRDNGIGISKLKCDQSGLGMKNIDYRAKRLNARYKFKSCQGTGTCFVLIVPMRGNTELV